MRHRLLAALLLAACVASSQEPPPRRAVPSQPEQRSARDEPGKQKADQSPPAKLLSPALGVPDADHAATDKAGDGKQAPAPDWITWFTGALVVCAVAQFVATAVQAKYTRDALDLTRKATKAAQDSANAATKSALSAEQALTLLERPWITFSNPLTEGWHQDFVAGKTLIAAVPRVANSGRSPAFLLAMDARFYVGGLPNPIKVFRELLKKPASGVLAPGNAFLLPAVRMGAQHDLPDHCYLIVSVKYSDIYRRRHRSVCIWHYQPKTNEFIVVYAPDLHRNT